MVERILSGVVVLMMVLSVGYVLFAGDSAITSTGFAVVTNSDSSAVSFPNPCGNDFKTCATGIRGFVARNDPNAGDFPDHDIWYCEVWDDVYDPDSFVNAPVVLCGSLKPSQDNNRNSNDANSNSDVCGDELNGCKGSQNKYIGSDRSNSQYVWFCRIGRTLSAVGCTEGSQTGGGGEVSVDGVCGGGPRACNQGVVSSYCSKSGNRMVWTCSGEDGGRDQTCCGVRFDESFEGGGYSVEPCNDVCEQDGGEVSVDGVCGGGPRACNQGVVSSYCSKSGNRMVWTCSGEDGGRDQTCCGVRFDESFEGGGYSVEPCNDVCEQDGGEVSVDGACDLINYDCISGRVEDAAILGDSVRWICKGMNGGEDSGYCEALVDDCRPPNCYSENLPVIPDTSTEDDPADIVAGECSSELDSCNVGIPFDVSDNASHYLWKCVGSNNNYNSDSADSCDLIKDSGGLSSGDLNEWCNSRYVGCRQRSSVQESTPSHSHDKWICVKQLGENRHGRITCSIERQRHEGLCGTSKGECIVGERRRHAHTNELSDRDVWICAGLGGETNCHKNKDGNSVTISTNSDGKRLTG